MPLYLYKCEGCGSKVEVLQSIVDGIPLCCGKAMTKLPTAPVMIKMKGEGGTPILSKGYKEGYSKEYLRDVSPEKT